MEFTKIFDNKKDIIKYIISVIILFQMLTYIEINLLQISIFIVSCFIIFYYYTYQNSINKKYNLFIQKYNLKFNTKENILLIKYLYNIENRTNKKLFLELLQTLNSFVIYYKMNDIENTTILMKQCLNIHHSMYLEDNGDFNDILNSYINNLNKTMKENIDITRNTKFNYENDIETLHSSYNNNFEYY